MTFRQRLQNPFIQQYLLEILLPLVGYFFFDWSLVIITAFYIIDQIASEISFLRKFKAIRNAENKTGRALFSASIILMILMLAFESFLLLDYFAAPGVDRLHPLFNELTTFAKEELWLLFPLVLVMYYVKDQFTFFVPRRFLKKESVSYFRWHWIENAVIIVLVIAGTQLAKNLHLNDVIIISIFLALKLTFDFTIAKIADRKSNRAD